MAAEIEVTQNFDDTARARRFCDDKERKIMPNPKLGDSTGIPSKKKKNKTNT